MSYPSAAALVLAASGDARAALDALDDAQLDGLRTAAIAAVEEHCGQSFTATTEQRLIDGDGGTLLRLPQRLSAITALEIAGTSLTVDDVILSPDRDKLTIRPLQTSSAYLRAMAEMDPDSRYRRFSTSYASVAITGTWGWADDETPAAVAVALRIDMEDNALADSNALSSSVQAYRAMGLRSIRQGNLTADLAGIPGLSMKAQRALAGLVWAGPGAVA